MKRPLKCLYNYSNCLTRLCFTPMVFLVVCISCTTAENQGAGISQSQISFYGAYTANGNWDINNPEKIRIVDSKDSIHRKVLELHPGASNTFVLLKGTNYETSNLSVEGDVLFPEYDHNYLGFIYNYKVTGIRADYGCIYIKGNDSYVRVNPHRDGNVSRVLYNEYKTSLTGSDSIITNQWQHFKAEVRDSICHFYVGDMNIPKITYNFHEFSSGRIGFEPRVIGSEVWIDNISVSGIDHLNYTETSVHKDVQYEPEKTID